MNSIGPLYDLSWLQTPQAVQDWSDGNGRIAPTQNISALSQRLTKGLGVLNGATGIINTASNAAQVHNNPVFDTNYANMQSYGTRDYNTNRELARDMSMMQHTYMPQSYEKVRGMTNGEKWGAVVSPALTGAAAGAQFGPIGALAGFGIGTIGGATGVALGDQRAKINTAYDNMQMDIAYNNGLKTANAAGEHFADVNNRQKEMHVVRSGGKIDRRADDMEFYRNRMLRRRPTIFPERTLCNGGVMVKVKMK